MKEGELRRPSRPALALFGTLRAFRAFEKRHLHFARTMEDRDLVQEIGYHQEMGRPLSQKALFLLDIGSVATVQRRLRRLHHLGIIHRQRAERDRRLMEFTLTPKVLAVFERYGELLKRRVGG